MERRLAAILAADVVGYSRLVRADEDGTLASLKALRTELVEPRIAEHNGRVVKLMGDGMLAEFGSVTSAVQMATEAQRAIAEHNAALPADRRIMFRVGVNLGDVVIDGDDIHGDGVNLAARLEALAEPGGVCISAAVYEQVRDKLDLPFRDMGAQDLKNIDRPVQVWQWEAATASVTAEEARQPTFALPDKPSIAVLPLDNMSGEAGQDYFADGLTEDIITELSRFQTFFVIARHSSFVYKGRPVTVQQVGQELGVHYVVEGSVRRAGGTLRVTVQLIEAASGTHVWAERYDHEFAEIFDLQDEITRAIVAAIPGRLAKADLHRISRKRPENTSAYDYMLRGKMHHHRCTPEDNSEAVRLLDKAIELDPEFAEAHAWLSCTYGQALLAGFGDNKAELFALDVAAAERALALNDNIPDIQWIMCELSLMGGRPEQAEQHHEKAFVLNPNDPRIVAQRGELMTWLGRPEDGAEWARLAMRLDPYDAAGRAHLLGRALFVAHDYAGAIEAFKQVRKLRFGHHAEIAACHAYLGSDESAGLHAGEVLTLKPDFTVSGHVDGLPFKQPADRAHYRDGLLKAGLPA